MLPRPAEGVVPAASIQALARDRARRGRRIAPLTSTAAAPPSLNRTIQRSPDQSIEQDDIGLGLCDGYFMHGLHSRRRIDTFAHTRGSRSICRATECLGREPVYCRIRLVIQMFPASSRSPLMKGP
jgi:hypothetical protein